MIKKRRHIQYYKYSCNLSGQNFRTTREAKNPGDLVSVLGFYEMNPEMDDRPEAARILAKEERDQELERERLEELARQEAIAKGLTPKNNH